MPGVPAVKKSPTGAGQSDGGETAILDLGNRAYGAAYADFLPGRFTPANVNAHLDDMVMNFVGANTLESRRTLTIAGHPAREFVFRTPANEVVAGRIAIVRNRFFQLFVMGTAGTERDPDARRFLESFKLTAG